MFVLGTLPVVSKSSSFVSVPADSFGQVTARRVTRFTFTNRFGTCRLSARILQTGILHLLRPFLNKFILLRLLYLLSITSAAYLCCLTKAIKGMTTGVPLEVRSIHDYISTPFDTIKDSLLMIELEELSHSSQK